MPVITDTPAASPSTPSMEFMAMAMEPSHTTVNTLPAIPSGTTEPRNRMGMDVPAPRRSHRAQPLRHPPHLIRDGVGEQQRQEPRDQEGGNVHGFTILVLCPRSINASPLLCPVSQTTGSPTDPHARAGWPRPAGARPRAP